MWSVLKGLQKLLITYCLAHVVGYAQTPVVPSVPPPIPLTAPSVTTLAQPLPVPELQARVQDFTSTLSAAQVAALTSQIHVIEQQIGTQIAVLLIASTQPESIEAFGHRIASQWKLGRKNVGDGLLIVIAIHDRHIRIEVARALEGVIPDLLASQIIEQYMAPHFQQGLYAQGIEAALNGIATHLAHANLAAPSSPTAYTWQRWKLSSTTIITAVIVIALALLLITLCFGKKGAVLTLSTLLGLALSSLLLGALYLLIKHIPTWAWAVVVFLVVTNVLRAKFSKPIAGLIAGLLAAAITYFVTRDWSYTGLAAIVTFAWTYCLQLGANAPNGRSSDYSVSRSSNNSHSSSSSHSSRNSGSGGGGSFGGGGASGKW